MQIAVAFLPQFVAPAPAERGVCIVIDILRATTTLTTLLEYGAIGVIVAADAATAREEKQIDHEAILLGEIGGLRPADFDYGNSPHELHREHVAGKRAICHTTNGTAAIRAVRGATATLLGCLRNASAVVAEAWQLARNAGVPVTVVCAGGAGGRTFALDDSLVAGQLVALLLDTAVRSGVVPSLDDAADAARMLHHAEFGGVLRPAASAWATALARTGAGQHLAAIGLAEDVPFCAQLDTTTVVPVARPQREQIILTAALGQRD
jgi:2-phosphosulfolactate phosphatase